MAKVVPIRESIVTRPCYPEDEGMEVLWNDPHRVPQWKEKEMVASVNPSERNTAIPCS